MINSVKIFLYSFLLILFARCDNSIIYTNEISDQSSTEIIDDNNNKNFISPNNKSYSFLALGDSYTVGEGVSYEESWPSQFVDYALERGIDFKNPELIAQTGWKTYDLLNAIKSSNLSVKYDFISLLIGVNNQFNSRPLSEFEDDLNEILTEINYLKKGNSKVIVISIPDWGYSPYGSSYDRERISDEIDQFNNILKKISEQNNLNFVDVTQISRLAIKEPNLIAEDKLHPSGLMYFEWVEKIYESWIN